MRPALTAIVTDPQRGGQHPRVPREPRLRGRDPARRLLLDGRDGRDRAVVPEACRSSSASTSARRPRRTGRWTRSTTPWLLIVDADERVPEALAREIAALLERGPEADAYFIRRQNVFLDRVIRHSGWSTDKVVRLIRARHGAVPEPARARGPRHRRGRRRRCSTPMLHHTCRSLDQYLEKLHRYATWGAADAFRQGRRAGPIELLFRPLLAVRSDVRRPGRVPRRPPRPRPLRAAGVGRLPQVGAGSGSGSGSARTAGRSSCPHMMSRRKRGKAARTDDRDL